MGAGSRQCQRPRPVLHQRARAAHRSGVGAGGGLVEDDRGIVGDVALQAGGGAGKRAGIDRGAAAVIVVA
ncbi:hypothetical protein D3C83_172370 [compost metagenome]